MGGKVFVLEPDLLFSSRVESAVLNSGLEVKVTTTVDELQSALKESDPKALLVNLDTFARLGAPLIVSLRGQCRLIGYYSHIKSKIAVQALANGFERVLPRRTFMYELNNLLVELNSS